MIQEPTKFCAGCSVTKPLEVTWLCKPCHGARHREINAMKRAGVDLTARGF
jgi:hypothetical protein